MQRVKKRIMQKDRLCPWEQILSFQIRHDFQKVIDVPKSKQEVTKFFSIVKTFGIIPNVSSHINPFPAE